MLTEIQELCGFDPLVRIQRTSIDRLDIKLAFRCTQHSFNTFSDLDFLIEPVKAAVEWMAEKDRDKMARGAFKRGDMAAT